MRVVHVHRIAGVGGSERHLLTLLPALAAAGAEPVMVGLDESRARSQEFYDALDARVRTIRVAAPRDVDPVLAWRVAAAVRSARPDLVHTHLVHGDVYGAVAAVAARVPLVTTKHNDDPFRIGPYRHFERVLARRASHVIAITEALARFTIDRVGLPEEKVRVVHYGLDAVPGAWGPNPTIEVPADARVILTVARLVRQKGLDVAVRALRDLVRDEPRAILVVLGEGPERDALERLAAELGVAANLRLAGRAGDVAAWLERAELLVHPARWEGFGLVLLEAMLAGLPVVATRTSAIPEVVADAETGLLVPPDDPAALAAAIRRVLADRDLAADLGRAGRARARRSFSTAAMAQATLRVYAEARRTTASAHDATV